MSKILINIISGQILPNYVATKHVNPNICILLYSKDSEILLNSFKDFFKDEIEFKEFKIDAWDYFKNYQIIKDIFNEYKNEEIISNFTGGTKIMSLALFNAAKEKNIKNIYINTQDNEIVEYTDDKKTLPIEIETNIKDIFKLNEQEVDIKDPKMDKDYEKLYNILINLYRIYEKYINKFRVNYKKIKSINPAENGPIKGTFIQVKNKKSKIRLVLDEKVLFEKEENGENLIKFIIGSWFEYHCYEALKKLNYFDELAINVTLKVNNPKIDSDKNEIDIIGLKGIYPYIFECKAGNVDATYIDKLYGLKDSITRYSNLYVITFYHFNKSNPRYASVVQKAKEKKIEIITYDDIINKRVNFNKRANLK